MICRSVVLRFSSECVGMPLISELVREWGIEVNILHARIRPSEEGRMLARFRCSETVMEKALASLEERGVDTLFPESSFIWNDELCVHCGACAGVCPPEAFTLNRESYRVEFDLSRCILCQLCVQACCYGAVQPVEEYVDSIGGAE